MRVIGRLGYKESLAICRVKYQIGYIICKEMPCKNHVQNHSSSDYMEGYYHRGWWPAVLHCHWNRMRKKKKKGIKMELEEFKLPENLSWLTGEGSIQEELYNRHLSSLIFFFEKRYSSDKILSISQIIW